MGGARSEDCALERRPQLPNSSRWERSIQEALAKMASTPSSTRRSRRVTWSRPVQTHTRSFGGDRRASSGSPAAQIPDATSSRSTKMERPRCVRRSHDAAERRDRGGWFSRSTAKGHSTASGPGRWPSPPPWGPPAVGEHLLLTHGSCDPLPFNSRVRRPPTAPAPPGRGAEAAAVRFEADRSLLRR